MSTEKFDEKDFVSHDDAEGLDDDGSSPGDTEEEDTEDTKKPEKKEKDTDKKAAKNDDEEDDTEESEEDDDTEESEEEDEEEDKGAKKKANPRIERMRSQRDKARAELEQLRLQLREQEKRQSDDAKKKLDKIAQEREELYEQIEEFRAQGKTKEAAAAQRKLDNINQELTRNQARALAVRDATVAAETRIYNSMVAELEVIDPRFDKTHDDFDPDLVEEVSELVEAYEAKNFSASEALRKAVKAVLREDVFSKKSRQASADLRRKGEEKTTKKPTNIEKNLAAAKKQPPSEPGATKEKSKVIDVLKMSEKDFDALPASKLAELDGSNG